MNKLLLNKIPEERALKDCVVMYPEDWDSIELYPEEGGVDAGVILGDTLERPVVFFWPSLIEEMSDKEVADVSLKVMKMYSKNVEGVCRFQFLKFRDVTEDDDVLFAYYEAVEEDGVGVIIRNS